MDFWQALANICAVAGFIGGVLIPIWRWMNCRLSLRYEISPFWPKSPRDAHVTVRIHHDSGPAFRLERVRILFLDPSTYSEVSPARTLSLREAPEDHPRPMVAPLDTIGAYESLAFFHNLERFEAERPILVQLQVLSQGVVRREWDISTEFAQIAREFVRQCREAGQELPTPDKPVAVLMQ